MPSISITEIFPHSVLQLIRSIHHWSVTPALMLGFICRPWTGCPVFFCSLSKISRVKSKTFSKIDYWNLLLLISNLGIILEHCVFCQSLIIKKRRYIGNSFVFHFVRSPYKYLWIYRLKNEKYRKVYSAVFPKIPFLCATFSKCWQKLHRFWAQWKFIFDLTPR